MQRVQRKHAVERLSSASNCLKLHSAALGGFRRCYAVVGVLSQWLKAPETAREFLKPPKTAV
eukprot:4206104-Alexandrium_andersonii.AAC.1